MLSHFMLYQRLAARHSCGWGVVQKSLGGCLDCEVAHANYWTSAISMLQHRKHISKTSAVEVGLVPAYPGQLQLHGNLLCTAHGFHLSNMGAHISDNAASKSNNFTPNYGNGSNMYDGAGVNGGVCAVLSHREHYDMKDAELLPSPACLY